MKMEQQRKAKHAQAYMYVQLNLCQNRCRCHMQQEMLTSHGCLEQVAERLI